MPSKRNGRSRDEFVEAATALIEEHGWAALTMRALGDAMGIEHSVVYRHFSNKRALIDAVLDHALATLHVDIQRVDGSPRDRILATLLGFRAMVRAHPHLGPAIMERQIATPTGQALIRSVVDDLAAMGLTDDLLVCCYQALETLTIGAAVYDYSRPAGRLSDRGTQYRSLGLDAFTTHGSDDASVAAITERAFTLSIAAVLDTFVAAAR